MQSVSLLVVALLIGLAQPASAIAVPEVPDAGATGLLLATGVLAVAGAMRVLRGRK